MFLRPHDIMGIGYWDLMFTMTVMWMKNLRVMI